MLPDADGSQVIQRENNHWSAYQGQVLSLTKQGHEEYGLTSVEPSSNEEFSFIQLLGELDRTENLDNE
jgi:hypothetical protein